MMSIKNYFYFLLFLFFISCHNIERKYNTLYLSTSNGDMYSINLKKEKLNWKISGNKDTDEITYFTILDSVIYRTYCDGRIIELNKVSGKINWEYNDKVSPDQSSYGYDFSDVDFLLFYQYPIVFGKSIIFANSHGELKSIDIQTKKTNWTNQYPFPIQSSPIIYKNYLAVSLASNVSIIDPHTGKGIMYVDSQNSIYNEVIKDEKFFYSVDEHGIVLCMDEKDVQWQYTPEKKLYITNNLVIDENNVFYGRDEIVCLDKLSGTKKWQIRVCKIEFPKSDEEVLGNKHFLIPNEEYLEAIETNFDDLVANTEHYILLINKNNGKLTKRKYFSNRKIVGKVNYVNSFFYYLCSDNNLYKIDTKLQNESIVLKDVHYKTDRNLDETFMIFE
jgi:outer membrane protein assembly factor BamB